MKMKILKILFFACLIVPVMTQAQRFDRDEIESLRVAIFTKQMELTPAESKVFWPIYNKFREAMNKQHRSRRERMRDRKSVVSGKRVSVRVDLGGRRNIKKK